MSIPSKTITKRSEGPHPLVDGRDPIPLSAMWQNCPRLLRALLFDTTNSGFVQFFRYGVVGGVAFVCDFGTLWGATDVFGLYYLHSAALGFFVGLVVNYLLSVRWVFEKRRFSSTSVQFGLFALVGVVGVGINELIMWLLTDGLRWHYLASKLAATVLVYLWNFSIRRALIF